MKIPIIVLLSMLYFESISQNLNVEGGPILLPRMNSIEIGQISPVPGMVLYNIEKNKFQGFVADNIFLSSEKGNICVESSDEINLSNYSIKIDYGSNRSDSILVAVELYTISSAYSGSLALYDSDPCYSNTPIAQTDVANSLESGYTRFTFNSPVEFAENQSYWLVTHSGTIQVPNDCYPTNVSTYSYIPPPSPGEYCSVQDASPRLQLIGVGGWVYLH